MLAWLCATLSLQGEGQEGAILAFFHSPGRFDKAALAAYMCLAFVLAVVTYGAQVPSGLFVPCILMGGAFGRLWGELLRDWAGAAILPGSYALVGAAAMLAERSCSSRTIGGTRRRRRV